jgi:hypothetical protein
LASKPEQVYQVRVEQTAEQVTVTSSR